MICRICKLSETANQQVIKIKSLHVGVIIFGLVWFLSKKITKLNFFFKIRNRVKPTGFGSVQFFRAKTGSNRFGSVFPVWLGFGLVFSVLARFFPVLAWFFWFGSVFFPVFFCFGSVRFFAYKTKTEPAGFFKILIGFFFNSVFSIFFSNFLSLIDFFPYL